MLHHLRMSQDAWAALTGPFVEGAYGSVKEQVRTYVLRCQLLAPLPEPPADPVCLKCATTVRSTSSTMITNRALGTGY